MKKLSILISLILIIIRAASAQTQKGDQNLGLGFGFYSSNGNYNDLSVNPASYGSLGTTSFSTNPSYSYFIAQNLDIGASLGFGNETVNESDKSIYQTSKSLTKSYNSTIYLRKYFLFNSKIGIRTGPYLLYQYSSSNTTYNPTSYSPTYYATIRNSQVGINADFVYYPSKKIGLAVNIGSLSYTHYSVGTPEDSSSNNGVGFQFLTSNLMLSAFYVIGH